MTKQGLTLKHLLGLDLSRLEHEVTHSTARLLLRNLRIVLHVGRGLVKGQHNERAAALTYFSLLSLMPLLAVMFSLFKAFGGMSLAEQRAKEFLLMYLASEGQTQVSEWLDHFIAGFNAGAVGVVGMAALLVTVILTLSSIEEALNRTWGFKENRPWGLRLVVYWSLITVAPLLVGSSIALTASWQSSAVLVWFQVHIPWFGVFKRLVPVMFTALAFSAMYFILPAARVRFSSALAGGLLAGIIFEAAKSLYTVYAARSVANNPLYGSLAAIPFFIIWLNYSWRIILFGADVAHAIQYASIDPTEETDPRTNQVTREEAAVRLVARVSREYAQGRTPPTTLELASRLLLPAHLCETLVKHLLDAGLLQQASDKGGGGLLPSRPLESLTVADVVRVLRRRIGVTHWSVANDSRDGIDRLLGEVEQSCMARFGETTWASLAGM